MRPPAGTTSRSPGKWALTASRRVAAYGATSARSALPVCRGAHPDFTNARNSSVVGLLRFSLFFCSSLTGPSSHLPTPRSSPHDDLAFASMCREDPGFAPILRGDPVYEALVRTTAW